MKVNISKEKYNITDKIIDIEYVSNDECKERLLAYYNRINSLYDELEEIEFAQYKYSPENQRESSY